MIAWNFIRMQLINCADIWQSECAKSDALLRPPSSQNVH